MMYKGFFSFAVAVILATSFAVAQEKTQTSVVKIDACGERFYIGQTLKANKKWRTNGMFYQKMDEDGRTCTLLVPSQKNKKIKSITIEGKGSFTFVPSLQKNGRFVGKIMFNGEPQLKVDSYNRFLEVLKEGIRKGKSVKFASYGEKVQDSVPAIFHKFIIICASPSKCFTVDSYEEYSGPEYETSDKKKNEQKKEGKMKFELLNSQVSSEPSSQTSLR